MAIQQQLNQLLYSANIGAGFYSQTPKAKGRYEAKRLEKHGQKQADTIFSYIDDFMASQGKAKKEVWTKEDFTPESFDLLKKYHSKKQETAYRAWNADPTDERFEAYVSSVKANREIKALGNEWFPKAKGRKMTEQALGEAVVNENMKAQHQDNVFNEDGDE